MNSRKAFTIIEAELTEALTSTGSEISAELEESLDILREGLRGEADPRDLADAFEVVKEELEAIDIDMSGELEEALETLEEEIENPGPVGVQLSSLTLAEDDDADLDPAEVAGYSYSQGVPTYDDEVNAGI